MADEIRGELRSAEGDLLVMPANSLWSVLIILLSLCVRIQTTATTTSSMSRKVTENPKLFIQCTVFGAFFAFAFAFAQGEVSCICVHACASAEVNLCVPLVVTTPLISRVNNHALFAPLPRSHDRKLWWLSVSVCVWLKGLIFCFAPPHLSLRSQAPSPPYSRCGSCTVWMASFKS